MKTSIIGILFIFFISLESYSQNQFVEKSGDAFQVLLPAAAIGSCFIWKDDSKPALQFVKAFGLSFLSTHGLKRITKKERPNGGMHAFPSGHTSAAFTGATFLAKRFGWKTAIPSYLLASYVGWTRVETNHHDYVDVIAGAGIGIICSYIFTKPYLNDNFKIDVNANTSNFQLDLNIKF